MTFRKNNLKLVKHKLFFVTSCRGFTLFEVVLVLVLIGIISVAVIPSWNSAQVNLNRQSDLLARNLRHAQAVAIHRATPLTIDLSAAAYSVKDGVSVITDPATGDPFTVTLENGVTFSSFTDFDLDSLGRPSNGVSLLSTDTTQTMNGGSRSRVITITPVTGSVSVAEG